jgi:uncharacterized protein (DUF433 family)
VLASRKVDIMGQRNGPQGAPRQLAPRIESDPDILGGKPVIAGSRLSVETILENLACGDTYEDLLDSYPFLTREDIYAALDYAAQVMSAPAAS